VFKLICYVKTHLAELLDSGKKVQPVLANVFIAGKFVKQARHAVFFVQMPFF